MVLSEQANFPRKEKILSLLRDYGQDSLSYFHLHDNRHYFFPPSGKSFLSFNIFNKVAVVATDPIGPDSEIPSLIQSFVAYVYAWRLSPCFIGVSTKYLKVFKEMDFKIKKIGEEAIINLVLFERKQLKKKVRRAVSHIEKLGIHVFFFTPANIPYSIYKQLEEISAYWLEEKGGKEKGFSMTLGRIPTRFDRDCQIAVAIKEGVVVGYLCFAPVYQTKMMSLDQARRRTDSPNGLNEFLIVKSAEYFKEKNIKKLSLNFATFSNIASGVTPQEVLKKVIYWILQKMYNCHSLRYFNEKFYPKWESRYIVYSSIFHLPLSLLAILRAER